MYVGFNVTDEQADMFGTAVFTITTDLVGTVLINDELADGTPVTLGCAVSVDDETGDEHILPMLMLITPEIRHLFGDRLTH